MANPSFLAHPLDITTHTTTAIHQLTRTSLITWLTNKVRATFPSRETRDLKQLLPPTIIGLVSAILEPTTLYRMAAPTEPSDATVQSPAASYSWPPERVWTPRSGDVLKKRPLSPALFLILKYLFLVPSGFLCVSIYNKKIKRAHIHTSLYIIKKNESHIRLVYQALYFLSLRFWEYLSEL